MAEFVGTDKRDDKINMNNLSLLCEALGVSKSIIKELESFDVRFLDNIGAKETVTIWSGIISDYAEIVLTTDVSDKAIRVCSLYPNEEGVYWGWVIEYIRDILIGEMIKRQIDYRIKEYPPAENKIGI